MEEKQTYILVTGASSGIGRQIAIRLSEKYRLIIGGRNKERLLETMKACNTGKEHLIWEFDLLDVNALEESLVTFMTEQNCLVSNFIHSAGYLKTIPLKMSGVDLFQTSFNINVVSAAIIVKVLYRKKINQDALKSIVLISSNISNFGAKAFSAYGASKAAVDGLMRSLAVELAPKVRVNSVLPGGIRTAMTEHIYEDTALAERTNHVCPLGPGTPDDIAGTVSFLISEDARWITGQQLTVDGGRTINITG